MTFISRIWNSSCVAILFPRWVFLVWQGINNNSKQSGDSPEPPLSSGHLLLLHLVQLGGCFLPVCFVCAGAQFIIICRRAGLIRATPPLQEATSEHSAHHLFSILVTALQFLFGRLSFALPPKMWVFPSPWPLWLAQEEVCDPVWSNST